MASNVASTTDQMRQDFQHSTTIDGLLKNVYIPALNNVTFHATPLMEMFGDFGGTIDFATNKIIKAFKYQGAGGFGGISEGGSWVKGRNQKGFQGYERLKYLNAYVSLTGPAARTVKAGAGGYVDAISSAMDDTLKLARQQMERIIGGAGTGELCRFANAEDNEVLTLEYVGTTDGVSSTTYSASTTILTATSGGGYSMASWLQPGMRVNLVASGNFDGTIPTTDFVEATDTTRAVFEIGHVDYDNNTFSLKNVSGQTVDADEMGVETLVLVLENAYGAIEDPENSTIDQCLEPNGLYNLIDAGGTYTTIWNRTRTTYPRALKSKVVAAASAELDEELMMGWILDMANLRNNVPNTLVVDPKSRLKYFSNRKEDRRFDTPVLDSSFGFRRMGVTIDQYTLFLESLASLTPGTLFMLNTGDFKFAKATGGFEWVTDGPMGAFRQKEGSDNLYATAINYMNFVCENPMGQLKVTGLSYS